MDCGTNPGVDQPLSSACTRRRAPRPKGGCLRSSRDDPPHVAPPRGKPLIANPNFPERLLEVKRLMPLLSCSGKAAPWESRIFCDTEHMCFCSRDRFGEWSLAFSAGRVPQYSV